jgi:hypothetical protein
MLTKFLAKVVIASFCVFVMPIVYLLGLRHDISSAIATAAFGFCGIIVLFIVFGFKFLTIFKITVPTKIASDDLSSQFSTQNFSNLTTIPPEVLRTMSPEEQYGYYTQQIQRFIVLRLQIDAGSEGKLSRSSSHVSYHAAEPNQQGEPSPFEDQDQDPTISSAPKQPEEQC